MSDIFLDESYCNVNQLVELDNGTTSLELVSCLSRTAGYMGSIKTWASHLKTSDDIDYHGNFTDEPFEAWFGDLFKNLLDTPALSRSKSKAKMVEWLNMHGVTVPIHGYKI
ncbi:hypothetical protein PHMEG_0003778 [Phytophthora megakarya]|uniref:Uncharacterized protein n=1 Tax=Phytophthora megakarya TaxID=4795 RepID=A0A225WX82_9STRA|nr:hypothetical protein PHMEG_0003778 [Phytophthora megakarya]